MADFLEQIGVFTSDIGAEIVTYDPTNQLLFVVSGETTLEVLDVSDPTNPTPVDGISPIDIAAFGAPIAGANSVAFKDGILAVALEAETSTDPGVVVLVDLAAFAASADPLNDPNALQVVVVGALPDMVTFSPDGNTVLVANEGEPSEDYTVDPEGSVGIIDLSGGLSNVTATIADFTAFNDQIDALRDAGVRIFGPGATVAQDLEPEYITVSPDSTTAYVALQENNALAVVDIAAGEVTAILPLGFKDYNQGLETFFFDEADLPVLGTTEARGDIRLSGFSGLFYEGVNPENGNLIFVTHPDRGPDDGSRDTDGDGVEEDNRVFLLPDLQPQLVKFEFNPTSGDLTITDRIFLTDSEGNPLTGLPNLPGDDGGAIPLNEDLEVLPFDPLGADLEGVVRVEDGTYWLVDEYRPAIYHFEADGTLIERFVPEGLPPEVGTGALPEVYNTARDNRGFEAVAYQDGKIYAFIQTPMNNPVSQESMTIRILEFDPETSTTVGEYLYIQEDMGGGSDKIGDAVSLGDGEFLVIERDSGFGVTSEKNLFTISLDNATNLQELPDDILPAGATFESLTPDELADLGINPVSKDIYADLAELGYGFTDKPEGLAQIDSDTFAILNDNDFGETGVPIGLGILNLENPIDASNEDDGINIRNWPAFGMYQPDAIASYEVNGETFIVTANEGDSRDYDGFSEEVRVADVVLDPDAFPNAEELQLEENLGRLLITNTLGDTDGDGDFDELYSFGARSFAIWDSAGNLVFDSGSDFARITAEQVPEIFNSNGAPDTFDERSDDKGAEPEAVTLGTIGDRTYAFIGLERTGGIMIYDVTDPIRPSFIDYVDYLEDAPGNTAPEGFQFISADQSPTGENLLVVANEVSSTLAVFAINPGVRISDIQGAGHISPLEGELVEDVPGIVTAVDSNGFYLQDPTADANPETSEGIFVFTGDAPTVSVGDAVEVSGTVSEFIPGGADTGNLSITQISGDLEITVLSSGNELPEAVILGEPGRVPPNQIIDNDGLALFDPEQDGIDFYETVEGMRVTINDPLAVSATNRFGEIFTVANNGENATSLSDRGTINISPEDFNPERIQIQFDSGILPDFEQSVNVGAQLEDVTGVVGYSFGNYEVNVTEMFEVVEPSDLDPQVSDLTGGADELTFASYNVLNLDPNDDDGDTDVADGQFEAIAQQIVNNLSSPDIIALQEIQDNDGSVMSDVTAADETLQLLVDEIAAISGITYEFIDNPFIGNDTSGGQPGGNIRTAYLYNPDRVDLVEGSLSPVVDPTDQQTNPDNPFFDSRLPLAATFTFNGEDITLVNNHFSSKGGSSPLFGAVQPATELQEDPDVNGSLDERRAQAAAVQEFVDDVLAADPDANIAVLGDLNEFEFISAVEILEEDLVNLTNTLPPDERYTFIFQGNSQSLDHILVSENLAETAEFDIVHVNVEFAAAASDHEPLLAQVSFGENGTAAATLDFEGLAAGTLVTDQFADQGLTVSTDAEFGAMIFDTANPTGGDMDLASDDLGAVLIISEDGDTSDPDDNARGGTLTFEFDDLVGIGQVGLLDIDEPGSAITLYDGDGEVLDTVEIPELDGNSFQQVMLNIDNVGRLDIALAGSGAITGLDFTPMGVETV